MTDRDYAFVYRFWEDEISVGWIDAVGKRMVEGERIREYEHAWDISWSGSGFGTAWPGETDEDRYDMFFQHLDRTGRPTMEEVQLTTTGTAVTNGSTYYGPMLLPAGDEFILLWLDNRTGLYQVYLTRLTIHGEKLIDDVQITEHSENVDGGLTAAWTGSEVGIIWKTTPHVTPMRATIRMSTVTPDGTPVGGVEVLSTDARHSETPVILWSLGEYGVFFTKVLRDPLHSDLIFSRRHVDGTERTTETIYSTDPEWQIEEMKVSGQAPSTR